MSAKLVKGEDGNLSVIIGKGNLATKMNLGVDAQTYVERLVGRAIADMDAIGPKTVKNLLEIAYDRDLDLGMVASEKTSLTRAFASLVLANKSGDKVSMDSLVKGNYNTGILAEMAESALDGVDVGDTKAKLDAYHDKLVKDNASLPEEMKAMLEKVATMPLERPEKGEGEFVVKAPITVEIDKVVKAIPPPPGPVATVPRDIGGMEGIKNFVANLVFSDDTMVGDVVVNKPGEAMRKMLADDKNMIAFAEIVKNPAILDSAVAPQIAPAVKDGFVKMVAILDEAFQKTSGGKTLATAATERNFVEQFSLFMKDSSKLPGAELAKFDNIIQSMANKGCENIQKFINTVFNVNTGNANDAGALTTDPYKDKSADEIKAELKEKGLNQILDSGANADAPGQVGFFRQVISAYFTSLGKADKRSCFAAAMRYAKAFDFAGKEGQDLVSAQKNAVNKFTGAILKGTSPLLQKMMQGLPREIMGEYSDALNDMKSALAPIPRKIVQAQLAQLIEDSKGTDHEIESIELVRSIGAASVGEAFLCNFKLKGQSLAEQCVVKIMRHDAERRVKAEAEIFTQAAQKIGPGMAKTWEGQLKQYMTEFDFRNEANNVNEGVALYDIKDNEDHPLQAIGRNVASMKLSPLAKAKKDVLVAELVAYSKTADKFFAERVDTIRKATAELFEQDPDTGRIRWVDGPVDPQTGVAKKVPVIKQGVSSSAPNRVISRINHNYKDIKSAQKLLIQATKVWFHEALLGSGKFHGDTHSGNLMIGSGGSDITFIDFGNLYTLKKRDDGVDERHELLRVIMGATFRDKDFILQGFEKLLSPEGRVALEANKKKAEAILDTILSKGRFSYDMVYRLNAVVVELQKLGIELPPQFNCFVQSMARLSNSVVEMNTIVNQSSELLNAANDYVRQGPAPERDDLDILGMAFDFRATAEGHVLVDDDNDQVGVTNPDGTPAKISAFHHHLTDEGFGGIPLADSSAFRPGGAYHAKVVERLSNVADPVNEAKAIVEKFKANVNMEDIQQSSILLSAEEAVDTLAKDLADAKDDPEAKKKAIAKFAGTYSAGYNAILSQCQEAESQLVQTRIYETIERPRAFAYAIVTTLLDNFATLETTFADQKAKIVSDVYFITSNELKAGWFAGPESRIQSIKDDAKKMAGDGSYKVDIGV